MDRHGFIHEKLDIKILILFILRRLPGAVEPETLLELSQCDSGIGYFDYSDCLSELVETGHLKTDEKGRYSITEKGRQQGADVEDSLAVPVVQKVSVSIAEKQIQLRRDGFITTSVSQDDDGFWIATLNYRDDGMPMMRLSLMAPNEELAGRMAANLKKQADLLYKTNLDLAIESSSQQETKA